MLFHLTDPGGLKSNEYHLIRLLFEVYRIILYFLHWKLDFQTGKYHLM